MRYAEGPSIECHHIPIEQAHQPVSGFRHKCKLGTPLRLSLHDTADHVVLMSASHPDCTDLAENPDARRPACFLSAVDASPSAGKKEGCGRLAPGVGLFVWQKEGQPKCALALFLAT